MNFIKKLYFVLLIMFLNSATILQSLVQILLILVIKLIKFINISLLFLLSNPVKYYCLDNYYFMSSTIIFQSSYIYLNLQIISTLSSTFSAIIQYRSILSILY